MNYQQRLTKVIPGGAHTYSRGADQFPSNAPAILARGLGAQVWDLTGESYLDYGMGLRAVTLGYSHPSVNQAAFEQIQNGNNLTRPSLVELRAAEKMVELIPTFEMVKFAKNGSNVTTAAVKLARAYTGRSFVCVPRQQPFFTFDDWFIGGTSMDKGVPESSKFLTLYFDYGDIESLTSLFQSHPGEIAAVIMEPATTMVPCPTPCVKVLSDTNSCKSCPNIGSNFLHETQAMCRDNGALFILDEMITGFRWDLQGAGSYFGVEPDLSTFGKGMANGFSLAAVGGRRDVMEVGGINRPGEERTFLLSSTHGGEMSSLGAFLETVKMYEQYEVVGHMWEYGKQLRLGLQEVAKSTETSDFFSLDGPDISLNYVLRAADGEVSLPLKTLFAQEMIRNGVLMPWIAISLAHEEKELRKTLLATEASLKVVRKAVDSRVEEYLIGDTIKPVFRRFN